MKNTKNYIINQQQHLIFFYFNPHISFGNSTTFFLNFFNGDGLMLYIFLNSALMSRYALRFYI